MIDHSGYSALTRSFLTRELDNSSFHHREHVLVAYELLRNLSYTDAAFEYATGIRTLAAKAGAPKKFNATITYAFMSLIAEHMAMDKDDDFEDFAERNPELFSKNLLERWYEPERLHSDFARQAFLLPAAR